MKKSILKTILLVIGFTIAIISALAFNEADKTSALHTGYLNVATQCIATDVMCTDVPIL